MTATAALLPPCRFRFDVGPTFEGFAHGSTWNGFDNVAVTRETLDAIAEWAASTAPDDELSKREAREQFIIEPMACGLYSLGWGFATVIVRDATP
jgi:hypothetical protein